MYFNEMNQQTASEQPGAVVSLQMHDTNYNYDGWRQNM